MPVTVTAKQERDLIVEVLTHHGAGADEAFVQADVLTEADLRGLHSHGVQRVPVLVERMKKQLIKVKAVPEMTWTAEAVMNVDGKDGFGTYIADQALHAAAPRAKQQGIVAVAIRNSGHIGMLGYYCEHMAEENLICIAFTSSEALVHPFGGAEPLVGSNPIAVSFPASPFPLMLDMATSVSAIGKILTQKHKGEPIPDDWAIDSEGSPTTDPDAALGGALNPAGGPKGYGLGVAIGILAGLLPGGEIGKTVVGTLDVEYPCTKADLFLLLNPEVFGGGKTLSARVTAYREELRRSRPQKGFDRVMAPGDKERELRAERMESGIPLSEEVWHATEQLRAGG